MYDAELSKELNIFIFSKLGDLNTLSKLLIWYWLKTVLVDKIIFGLINKKKYPSGVSILDNFSPKPFKVKLLLITQAGTSEPISWAKEIRSLIETLIFDFLILLLNNLNNNKTAAASAEPPPNPAPSGIFLFKLISNLSSIPV